jgi:magnesium transporter
MIWGVAGSYGQHFVLLSLVSGLSVVGCVLAGTMSGAMLPFVLRRFGADPASASAPFVATLVDVSGILIYFGIANLVLRGVLL